MFAFKILAQLKGFRMEALLIIVCVAVGAVFLFMAIAMGWFLSLAVGRFLYVAGPFLGGSLTEYMFGLAATNLWVTL